MTLARKLDSIEDASDDAIEAAAPNAGEHVAVEVREKSSDAFRTIGEAAAELGLKTHVLRFWETKFDDLKPMKRPDGRRYYRPEDMEVLRTLQRLLHVQGLTIRGAVKVLKGEDDAEMAEAADAGPLDAETGASVRDLQDAVREAVDRGDFQMAAGQMAVAKSDASVARQRLETLLADLSGLKSRLDQVRLAN
jgi:DNA-binding transcriptional MerR regulator